MRGPRKLVAVILIAATAVGFMVWSPVNTPALALGLRAAFIDSDPSPALAPGATTKYTLHFRNVGLVAWQRGTDRQVNLGVVGDAAMYAEASTGIAVDWMSPTRIATATEPIVFPGGIGTFTFSVRAPGAPGTYRVPLGLVVDGVKWLDHEPVGIEVTSDLGFHGQLVEHSGHLTLRPGELSPTLTARFRNTGAKPWVRGLAGQQLALGVAGDDKSLGAVGVGWPAPDRVAVQAEPSVGPGGTATFNFRVRAPTVPGTYALRLRPVVDGVAWLEDENLVTLIRVVTSAAGAAAVDQPVATADKVSLGLPAFTITASVNPEGTVAGSSVSITANLTAVRAGTALIGIEVSAPSGAIVYQKWFHNESFSLGDQRKYPVTWAVSAGTVPGAYSVRVSAYSEGWKTLYDAKPAAANVLVNAAPSPSPAPTPGQTTLPTPTGGATVPPQGTSAATPTPATSVPPAPGPTFTTAASAAPASVAAGAPVNVTALVTSATSTTALVDLEIWAAGAASAAYQVWFDNQSFAAGQQRSYPATWSVPATAAAGTYTLKIGMFSPGWATLYGWTSPTTFAVSAAAPSPSPTPTPTIVPASVSINDTSFTYAGTWTASTGPGKYLSDDHYSTSVGSAFSITFTGTVLRLYSAVAPHHGIGAVSVDGGPETDMDLYAAVRQEQMLVYATPTLANTTHTVTVRVTGRKNPASTDFVVTADRADIVGTVVSPTPTPTPVPTPTLPPAPPPSGAPSPLHVSGNSLVNAAAQQVQLHGVNRAGTDYACVQGWGFIDGPSDAASVAAIKSWRTNAVRVPMNEDCWLAINGAPAAYSGANYQNFLKNWVNLITQNGLYAIIELHWSAPGSQLATGQNPMLDMDHSVTFWSQVASTFKGNGAVIFEPHNEPYPDNQQDTTAAWTCWRDGGTCPGVSYQAAGMQTIVNAIRATGATNIIALGGVSYSNALSQWLTYKPNDSLNNLVAVWHVYNFNTCNNATCYNNTIAPVAAQVPVIATEIGVDNCDSAFLNTVMNFLDARKQSYLAWVWATWGTACNSVALVSDYQGTATTYGQIYKTHLASLP